MEIIVNGQEMKSCDQNTINFFQIPALVLMERAALGVADEIKVLSESLVSGSTANIDASGTHILIICGTGNNGGDGLAVARLLYLKEYQVDVVLVGNKEKVTSETKHQLICLKKYGIEVLDEIPNRSYQMVIDCLFGIGLTRNIDDSKVLPEKEEAHGIRAVSKKSTSYGNYKEIIEVMNRMKGYKIAVDIPSGIHAETGQIMGVAFQADLTITFAYHKLGNLLYPGAAYAGRCIVKDIGISKESWLSRQPSAYLMTAQDLRLVPQRNFYSNKGTYGKVAVAAGCKNMAGAAFLSGKAAYSVGCGLVSIFTDVLNREILQCLLPEAVLTTYETNINEAALNSLLTESVMNKDVIVAGPGLGLSKIAEQIMVILLENADKPLILDADGLNVIAGHKELLKKYKGSIIITPHPGEMARLCEKDISYIQRNFLSVAKEFAAAYNVICVLKDARTVTALPDGVIYMNNSGNSGMASAGSGDVLTGVIAGLLAQGMKPQEAAPLGVYIHGLAGDYSACGRGKYGMSARDIIEGIVMVMKETQEKYAQENGTYVPGI